VVRVPAYSPYAVAEHTLGMILALNRKLHKAYTRVRDGNFALDGLLGFDIHNKTIGVIGTGKIGQIFCKLMHGFGTRILAFDKFPNQAMQDMGVEYVDLQTLYQQCDIISLHCPLTYETYHMINDYAIASMKPGVMIVNTSRGPLIQDDQFVRLETFPNVLITAHQAFFTKEAIQNISDTTFKNIKDYLETKGSENQVLPIEK